MPVFLSQAHPGEHGYLQFTSKTVAQRDHGRAQSRETKGGSSTKMDILTESSVSLSTAVPGGQEGGVGYRRLRSCRGEKECPQHICDPNSIT